MNPLWPYLPPNSKHFEFKTTASDFYNEKEHQLPIASIHANPIWTLRERETYHSKRKRQEAVQEMSSVCDELKHFAARVIDRAIDFV